MSETIQQPTPTRSLPLFLIGVALFLIGPIAVGVQFFALGKLWTPWYMPVLSTLGAALMIASACQRGGIPRIVGAVLFMLLCGAQWFLIGVARSEEHTSELQSR